MPRFATPLLLGAALLLAPLPTATAQLGGLVKKAQQKAAEKLGDKTAEKVTEKAADAGLAESPIFDEVVLELDERRLAGFMKGLTVAQETRRRLDITGKQREAMRLDSVSRVAEEKASKARARWDESNGRILHCIDHEVSARSDAKAEESERRMEQTMGRLMASGGQDPLMIKINDAQRRMAEAYAKGDTKSAEKFRGEIMKLMGIDVSVDSAAVMAKCGKPIPKPADVARADELRDQATTAATAARNAENAVNDAAGKASEMTGPQYAMAFERVESFMAKSNSMAFSSKERAALKAQRAELAGFFPK